MLAGRIGDLAIAQFTPSFDAFSGAQYRPFLAHATMFGAIVDDVPVSAMRTSTAYRLIGFQNNELHGRTRQEATSIAEQIRAAR
jgi:hypothetical protein